MSRSRGNYFAAEELASSSGALLHSIAIHADRSEVHALGAPTACSRRNDISVSDLAWATGRDLPMG